MQPRNPYLCLAIVAILGLVALVGVAGIVASAVAGREPPSALVSIAAGCVGSLASFLVSVPRGSAGFDERERKQN